MKLSDEDRAELQAALRSDKFDGSVSARAQIVLWHSEGRPKTEIAAVLGTTRPTVDKWIARYREYGLAGLVNRASPGGPRQIPDRIRSVVRARTRSSPPAELGISHWTTLEMSKFIKRTEGVYVSRTWIAQLWRENRLQPWRQGTFKISKAGRLNEHVALRRSSRTSPVDARTPRWPCPIGPPGALVRSQIRCRRRAVAHVLPSRRG